MGCRRLGILHTEERKKNTKWIYGVFFFWCAPVGAQHRLALASRCISLAQRDKPSESKCKALVYCQVILKFMCQKLLRTQPQGQDILSRPDQRHQKIRQVSTCRIFLSIAKAMVYHHDAVVDIITKGVYHQPQAVSSFAMMIYKAFALVIYKTSF